MSTSPFLSVTYTQSVSDGTTSTDCTAEQWTYTYHLFFANVSTAHNGWLHFLD